MNADGSVQVSAPFSMGTAHIEKAVQSREAWIRTHRDRQRSRYEALDPTRELLFLGKPCPVDIRPSENGRTGVTWSKKLNRLLVRCTSAERSGVEEVLSGWLRRKARQVLLPLIQELSVSTGIPFKKLYIRDQKTRWGSSSSRGNISINFRLVLAPPEVHRYLIIHELCHQRHFNHSREYWNEVARFCPEYREAEGWLKEHAVLLSLFR